MKRILFVVMTVLVFTSCQQEEFQIVEKSKCYKEIKVRVPPERVGGALWNMEAKDRIRIARPFFHPYKNALLIYLYAYPQPEDGPVSYASYDFETGESKIICNQAGYGQPPALSTKDWMAFNSRDGMMVVKINGDSLELAVPGAGANPPRGWSINGDTLYFQQHKTFRRNGIWVVFPDNGNSPESRGLPWSQEEEIFLDGSSGENKIYKLNRTGDTTEVITDPLGDPSTPVVKNGGLAWLSRTKVDNVPVSSLIWFESTTGIMKQIRKSNFLHGYETFSLSNDRKYLVVTWKSWKKKNDNTLEIIHEPRIMTLEGCDERPLVLPEPQ